jgi:hypothetical protein
MSESMTVIDLVRKAGGFGDFASGITLTRDGRDVINKYYGARRLTRRSPLLKSPLVARDVVYINRMR